MVYSDEWRKRSFLGGLGHCGLVAVRSSPLETLFVCKIAGSGQFACGVFTYSAVAMVIYSSHSHAQVGAGSLQYVCGVKSKVTSLIALYHVRYATCASRIGQAQPNDSRKINNVLCID